MSRSASRISRPTAAWYGCDGPATPRSLMSMRRRMITAGSSAGAVMATAAAHPECARSPMAAGEGMLGAALRISLPESRVIERMQ